MHHGAKTQNSRRLSPSVEKDPGNPKVIVSSGKRDDTGANQLSCEWRWYNVPHTFIDDTSNALHQLVLFPGRGQESHSHPLAKTALLYHVHKKVQPEY
jgi:hypothetical protein